MPAEYWTYWRVLDHQGILHLATGSMRIGEALCGWPPAGCLLTDMVINTTPPGENVNQPYDLICPICNYRS